MNGVCLMDKPQGLSSFAVLRKMKQHLSKVWDVPQKKIKIGHAGTLDPLASGLLLVCIGQATKISGYLMRDEKVYDLDVVLGAQTTTDDDEGEVMFANDQQPSFTDIEKVCKGMVGQSMQLPPNFSAIKHKGKKLYEYAREGIEIERTLRQVNIESIALHTYVYPTVKLTVACGKGTYMRALARDIGDALGVGAHAQHIRRTQSGEFNLHQAIALDDFLKQDQPQSMFLSLSEVLKPLPALWDFSDEQQRDLIHGKCLPSTADEGEYVLYTATKQVFALGEVSQRQVKVKRLLVDSVSI